VDTVEQARDGLLQQLAEQRRFLAVSCIAYDAGDQAEARRIATSLRVLLHDLGSARGLLVRLDTRDQIGWLDTAGSMLPLVPGVQTPLVFLKVDARLHWSQSSWLPTLDGWDRRLQERPRLPRDVEETLARMRAEHSLRSRGGWLPFAQWWAADILRDVDGQTFTRASVVKALANADGQEGNDPVLDETYRRLSRPDSYGRAMKLEEGSSVPLISPAPASVRQVAFEVETSLYRGAPTAQTPAPAARAGRDQSV
jgi:hypothetical protein